ncbi:MAG: AraC family transcriptional regulator [Bacteroidales bacterium]|nr:AraC family transcriptional regulator [Bacteroidales bacterium]
MEKFSLWTRLRLLLADLRHTDRIQRRMDARTRAAIREWTARKAYCEAATMEEVASTMGISKEQLSWYFRHRVRKTFLQWRKELRIREAQDIMRKRPALPASRIAAEVGIMDKGNFRRQFREITGMNPAEWRLRK